MPSETSQTLDRGLRALRVLAETPEGLTVTELSSRLQVNRTVVYRLISTLEQHGLVRRDARSRLFIGLGVLRRELNGLVAAWHHRTGQAHGITHNALRKECGGPPAAVANAEQLGERINRIREWAMKQTS